MNLLAHSLDEPVHLAHTFFTEVVPGNLLLLVAVVAVVWDSLSLDKRAPHAGPRLFELAKMTIISGVLFAQYTKLSGLGSAMANGSGAIFSAFGAASLGFAAVFAFSLRRYWSERTRLVAEINQAQLPACRAEAGRRRDRPTLLTRSRITWAACALLVIGIATFFYLKPRAANEPASQPAATTNANPPAQPQQVHFQSEVVDRISVGATAKHDSKAPGAEDSGTLPEGLRFYWQTGLWEPAFIQRRPDGSYWWQGHAVAANAPLLNAFALEGPAVRPDNSEGILFFHRDVLAHLSDEFAARAGDGPTPSITVDQSGHDVVLRIAGDPHRAAQSLVISAKL